MPTTDGKIEGWSMTTDIELRRQIDALVARTGATPRQARLALARAERETEPVSARVPEVPAQLEHERRQAVFERAVGIAQVTMMKFTPNRMAALRQIADGEIAAAPSTRRLIFAGLITVDPQIRSLDPVKATVEYTKRLVMHETPYVLTTLGRLVLDVTQARRAR